MQNVTALTAQERNRSKKLHAFAEELRGKFLTGAAWIETLLSDVIANYFCADEQRRSLFFSDIALEISLRRKTELLMTLLKKDFPTMLTKHPRLKHQLEALRLFRNRLAHSHTDTSKPALSAATPDEVTFIYYRNGKMQRQKVTRADAQQRAREANQLRRALIAIQANIIPKAGNNRS